MEELLKLILSEKGIVAGLFILTLYWIYKVAKWFWAWYLKLQEEHNKSFLKSFDAMIEKISTGDKTHSEEHNKIMEFLEDRHTNNNQQHIEIIKLVWEIDWNVQKNTHNIDILSQEIKLHHAT